MVLKLLHPKLRFEGWEPSGFYKRPADTRTAAELKASVEAWARRVPEVKQILPELKSMSKSQLGLVADTIELSQKKATFWLDVDMMEVPENRAFSALDALMSAIPIAVKKNPHSIDFSNAVINTSGQLTSKFFLKDAGDFDLLITDGVDKNFEKGIPVVETLSKLALNAPANGKPKFDRQEHFVDLVLALLDENVNVNKIPLIKDVFDGIGASGQKIFDIDKFLSDGTTIKTIKANLNGLASASNHAYSFGKHLDINAQLSKDPKDDYVYCREYFNDEEVKRIK